MQLGLVVRRRGIGSQITNGRVRRSIELRSLYSDLVRANKTLKTQVLAFEGMAANMTVTSALSVAAGPACGTSGAFAICRWKATGFDAQLAAF